MSGIMMQNPLIASVPRGLSSPPTKTAVSALTTAKKRKDDYRNVTLWPPFPAAESVPRTYVNQAPLPPSRCESLDGGGVDDVSFYVNQAASSQSSESVVRGVSSSGGGCFVSPTASSFSAEPGQEVPFLNVHHHIHHHVHHAAAAGDQRLMDLPVPSHPSSLWTTSSSSRPNFTPPPDVPFPVSRGPAGSNVNQTMLSPEERKLDYLTISKILDENRKKLQSSGWFHEKLGASESEELLKDTAPGTFLVRHSSDPRCLFSLSVQQGPVGVGAAGKDDKVRDGMGPTSSRIHFHNGKFQMDATDERIRQYMPRFDSVVELVEHYVKSTASDEGKNKNVWVDGEGNVYRIYLSKPLYKQPSGGNRPPCLLHLCRRAVHESIGEWKWVPSAGGGSTIKSTTLKRIQNLDAISELNVPASTKTYLKEYPHTM